MPTLAGRITPTRDNAGQTEQPAPRQRRPTPNDRDTGARVPASHSQRTVWILDLVASIFRGQFTWRRDASSAFGSSVLETLDKAWHNP